MRDVGYITGGVPRGRKDWNDAESCVSASLVAAAVASDEVENFEYDADVSVMFLSL